MKFIPQQPFVLPCTDRRSDTAVLFLHGITEGPDQFRRPAAWSMPAAALREAFRAFCRSLQEEHPAPHDDHVSPCC